MASCFGFLIAGQRRNLYDLRIRIPTFDKEDKWTVEIEIPPGGESSKAMELWTEQEKWWKCIAFTGQFNAGKTMILSVLTGREFPSGGKVSTLGISAVHVTEQNMLLLDSAGTDYVQTDHLADMGADTLEEIREHFCSDVLMDMSSNFVHVVGRLNRPAMRCLWGHLKRIQKTGRSDFTVVYNLYPHDKDMTVVKEKAQKIIDGYGDKVESFTDWTFLTCHGEGRHRVLVHHWFWLDDNWSVGRKINRAQIPNFWEHLQTLNAAEKDDGISTQDATKAALAKVTPRYMVPRGSTCEVKSQESAMDPKAKPAAPYITTMKVDVDLLSGARMQHVILVPNIHGQFVQAHDGFHPGVRIFRSPEEHVILIDAPNCVLADASNLPSFQYDYDSVRQPVEGQGFISIKMTTGQWKCVHIAITKNPYLKVEDYVRDDGYAAEQRGEFSLYHPPHGDQSSGKLQFWGGEFTNGLLVVRMKPASAPPPPPKPLLTLNLLGRGELSALPSEASPLSSHDVYRASNHDESVQQIVMEDTSVVTVTENPMIHDLQEQTRRILQEERLSIGGRSVAPSEASTAHGWRQLGVEEEMEAAGVTQLQR